MKYIYQLSIVLSFWIVVSCNQSDNKFSESVTSFEKNTKDVSTFYLYQETLKMLNIKRDSTLNNIIKEIVKVKIVRLSKDTLDSKIVEQLIPKIKKEKYLYLLELKQDEYKVVLFFRKKNEKPKEYIAVVYNSKDLTVIDLVGNIPIKFLPALLSGNIKMEGFNTIFDINQKSKKNKSPKPKDGNHTGNK